MSQKPMSQEWAENPVSRWGFFVSGSCGQNLNLRPHSGHEPPYSANAEEQAWRQWRRASSNEVEVSQRRPQIAQLQILPSEAPSAKVGPAPFSAQQAMNQIDWNPLQLVRCAGRHAVPEARRSGHHRHGLGIGREDRCTSSSQARRRRRSSWRGRPLR